MNEDGSGQTPLTDNEAGNGSPHWSPDRLRIAFDSDRDDPDYSDRNRIRDIYVMNADGSGQTRLTDGEALDFQPSWSPDGSRIAFSSVRDGAAEIYVMSADGSAQTRLTDKEARNYYPSWSPDGSLIAFTSYGDGNAEIYVMNADGSAQTRLTNNEAVDSRPSWSPDGLRIAFDSTLGDPDPGDDTRISNIYVMNADGSGLTRLTDNEARETSPSW